MTETKRPKRTGIRTNQKDFAAWWGVAPATAAKWIKQGMPVERDPNGRVTEIDSYVASQWVVKQFRKLDEDDEEMSDLRRRQEIARTRRMELEADKLAASVISVEDVQIAIRTGLQVVRSDLLSMPNGVASKVANLKEPTKIRQVILREVKRTLNGLAHNLRAFGAKPEDVDEPMVRKRKRS